MATVPRHLFVPPEARAQAYGDRALPISEGQTISQPYVVALMAQALSLRPSDRVLEVGAGSGYAAAVLSRLASEVYTIERWPALAETAERCLHDLGYMNVQSFTAMEPPGCRPTRHSTQLWSRRRRRGCHARCASSLAKAGGW